MGASVAAAPAGGQPGPPGSPAADRAYYVLPPGNYGGLPTTDESRDQLPLYDALTPLRGDVTDADIDANFLPEDFAPVGATREEPTGRPGTTILYDEYGVAHISGRTRADLAFGAGWVTARDRGLLLQLGRGPARAAVADIPGIDAFGLVTSGQSFVPSAATEQLVTDQVDLLVETYGDKGREIIADAQAEADGINAYWAAHGIDLPPATVNDVIAVTAFIGSIFGAGGGAEAANAELLAKLQAGLGAEPGDAGVGGRHARRRSRGPHHDQAALRLRAADRRPGHRLGGRRPRVDPVARPAAAAQRPASTQRRTGGVDTASAGRLDATYPAAGPVPAREASNFLVVDPKRSATGNTLAVMGPQLGYYYPEIVQQIHLSGPGIEAQGVGRARRRHVHPHRAHAGLRLEPHLGQPRRARRVRRAAVQPRRHAAHPSLDPLRVRGHVPAVRGVRRRHAERHADPLPPVGARAGHRHRHRRR